MRFVQNFASPDFRAKTFTPSKSTHLNSFSDKTHKKRLKMEKFTPLHNVYFVKYDVTVSFLAQVLDTVTYFVSQVLDTAS